MMRIIQEFDDIKEVYQEFLLTQQHPKLDNLSNWGKNRYFLSKYFPVEYTQCKAEQIIIIFNDHSYCLDIRHAPDFMDQDLYLEWLDHNLVQSNI